MELDNLEFKSRLGRPSVYTYRHHTGGTDALAIILPGQAYYKDAPVMWYSAVAAYQAGADTLSVEYGFQANRAALDRATMKYTLEELMLSLEEFLSKHQYTHLIMISKSIGTLFASQIGEIGKQEVKSHIFLTPLEGTIGFIRKSKKLLVMVGENDPLFDIEILTSDRSLGNVETVTFPGGDHILEIQGDFEASLKVLETVAEKCHEFTLSSIR